MEEYPLIIYHHGETYETLEELELNDIGKELAKEGFLVWIPERTAWTPANSLDIILESEGIGKEILKLAVGHPDIDKNNINMVGFGMGSWTMLASCSNSSDIRTMSLLEFGGPFEDKLMYQYVESLVENIEYEEVGPNILIMIIEDDEKINLNHTESLRKRLLEVNKTVVVIQYPPGDYSNLIGNKTYLMDIIKYLKNKVVTVASIEVNDQIIKKWERIWETGYW